MSRKPNPYTRTYLRKVGAAAARSPLAGAAPTKGRKRTIHDIGDDPDWNRDDDDDYVPEGGDTGQPRKRARIEQPTSPVGSSFKNFDSKANGTVRRKTAMQIQSETIEHASGEIHYRPTAVSGLVEPPGTTGGRKAAPEPKGIQVGIKWKEVGTKADRNTGIVDAHKGHLMALELGGSDIPENIRPQWANFQANGTWRKAEKAVLRKAQELEKVKQKLHLTVEVIYKKYERIEQATRKGIHFPVGFKMTATVCDAKGHPIPGTQPIEFFNGDQARDTTDEKQAAKALDAIDSDQSDMDLDIEDPDL